MTKSTVTRSRQDLRRARRASRSGEAGRCSTRLVEEDEVRLGSESASERTRCCWPPQSSCGKRSRSCRRGRRARAARGRVACARRAGRRSRRCRRPEVREEGVVLEDHPDPAPFRRHPGPAPATGCPSISISPASGARSRRSGAAASSCRSRWPEQGDELTGLDAQLRFVNGLDGAESLRDAVAADHPTGACKAHLTRTRFADRRLRSLCAARVRLPARLRPRRSRGRSRTRCRTSRQGRRRRRSPSAAARRGVVVVDDGRGPPGVEPVAGRACRSRRSRRRSSTSRSGSPTTTARRPPRARARRAAAPKRRGERPPPAARQALGGEAAPAHAVGDPGRRCRADRRRARRRRRPLPALRRDRQRQDRGLPPRVRGGARARPRRDRARARDRADAAGARALPRALRRPGRGAPLGLTEAERRDERERIARWRGARSSSARARRSSRRCAARR